MAKQTHFCKSKWFLTVIGLDHQARRAGSLRNRSQRRQVCFESPSAEGPVSPYLWAPGPIRSPRWMGNPSFHTSEGKLLPTIHRYGNWGPGRFQHTPRISISCWKGKWHLRQLLPASPTVHVFLNPKVDIFPSEERASLPLGDLFLPPPPGSNPKASSAFGKTPTGSWSHTEKIKKFRQFPKILTK